MITRMFFCCTLAVPIVSCIGCSSSEPAVIQADDDFKQRMKEAAKNRPEPTERGTALMSACRRRIPVEPRAEKRSSGINLVARRHFPNSQSRREFLVAGTLGNGYRFENLSFWGFR